MDEVKYIHTDHLPPPTRRPVQELANVIRLYRRNTAYYEIMFEGRIYETKGTRRWNTYGGAKNSLVYLLSRTYHNWANNLPWEETKEHVKIWLNGLMTVGVLQFRKIYPDTGVVEIINRPI